MAIVILWAVKSTLILVLTLGSAFLLRRSRAAVRHFVWTLGLSAALLCPLAAWVLPAWQIGLWPAADVSADEALPFTTWPLDATPAMMVGLAPTPPVDGASIAKLAMLVVWAAIASGLSIAILRSVLRARSLAMSSAPVDDPAWAEHVKSLCRALRIARRVDVRTTDKVSGPVTIGLVSATILLPPSAREWPRAVRESVLLHELGHVARWDVTTEIVAQVTTAIHWYNPLAWVAARRARELREIACDDLAVAFGAPPSQYASHLHALASTALRSSDRSLVAVAMSRRSALGERIRNILESGRPRTRLRRSSWAGGVMVGVVILCVVASLDGGNPSPAEGGGGRGLSVEELESSPAGSASVDEIEALQGDGAAPFERRAGISGRIEALWPSRGPAPAEPGASDEPAEGPGGFAPMGPIRTIGGGNGASAHFEFKSSGAGSGRRSIAEATPSTQGATGLSREAVRRVVHQSAGRIGLCDTYRGPRMPPGRRRVVVQFEIAASGSVTSADGRGELVDDSIVSCVVQSFRGLSFRPLEASLRITYPVVLTQGT